MCKKLMLLSCLVTLLGLSSIAFADFEVFKVDFSCRGNEATKKGEGWEDLEVYDGCKDERHDPTWLLAAGGTDIDVRAGQFGGHGNVFSRGGSPICNTTYKHWEDECGNDNIGLLLRGLAPDTAYTVYTYHAWDDGSITSVTVEGADSCDVMNMPQVVNTTSDVELLESSDVGEIQFITDQNGADVYIEFDGCVRFNAFALYSEVAPSEATSPNPSSPETDVCPEGLQLSWRPGGDVNDANGHDVYFDTDYNDVRDANRTSHPNLLDYSLGQDSNEYPEDGDPLLDLELMTTYYWRVDEVNDGNTWTGSIWSFTTEDGKAHDFSPEDGIRGFNPSSPLTWTPSCSATAYKLYFGTDFPESIVLFGDGFEGSFDPGWMSATWELHDASGDANYAHSGTWSAKATGSETLSSNNIDATDDANAIGVSFWVRTTEPMEADELQLEYYNGASYNPVSDFNIAELDPNGRWVQFTDTITDSDYLISNFRIRLTADIGSGTIYVDDVNVSNAWPVDPFWLETRLGGADNNYAPPLDPLTTYGWRLDTVIGSDVFQGEYGAFKTGLGGLVLEMLFEEGTPDDDLPATVTGTSDNHLVFKKYTGTTGSAKYGDGRFSGTSASAVFDPCAGLYRKDPCGPSDPPDLLRLDGYQYTIQFWAYLPAAGYPEKGQHMMVGKQNGWKIMIFDPTQDDDIRWYHGTGDKEDAVIAEGILPEIFDEWVHIAAVFDKTAQETQKLYIDGTVVASGRYQGMNPADNNEPVGIGVAVTNPPPFGFDRYFEGKIDELRIWDIALEPQLESASQPFPPDGSRDWDPNDPNLDTFTWKAGVYAQAIGGHEIYFGDSLDDVNESANPVATRDSNSWTHGIPLKIGKMYYWRVDEVNEIADKVWTGPIWKFLTEVVPIHDNIVVYYPLDETDGYDVPDYSGRHFDARCAKAPHWEPNNGRFGGCMHFSMEWGWDEEDEEWEWDNEEPASIETKSNYGAQMADMINNEISISVWVNGAPNQRIDDDMVVFEFCDEDYDDGIDDEEDSTKIVAIVPTEPTDRGHVAFRAGVHPKDTMTWRDFEPLAARDTWQHFVFIKNDANMYIYLNNELVATKTDCNSTSLADVNGSDNDATLKLGAWHDSGSEYHGRLDEFQIYNKALDAQEIESIFRGGELEPAWGPSPYDGQGNVSYNTDLTWRPGDYAISHNVFFGTSWEDVNSMTDPCDTKDLGDESYDPCLLELGQTYYWRVDEVNLAGPNTWKGDVWRFTVAEYFTIDDMEDYGPGYPISAIADEYGWESGMTGNGTGSIIDLVTPTEYTWVLAHGGNQAMYYTYDSSGTPYYSEISNSPHFELDPNDWTTAGVKMLTLWFHGDPDWEIPATAVERMYVGLEDTSNTYAEVVYAEGEGEEVNDIFIAEWQEWNIALSSFTNVNLESIAKLYIGFGDRDNPVEGGVGNVVFDNIRLYRPMCVPWKAKPEFDLNNDCVVDFGDVEIMADDWLEADVNLGDVINPTDQNLVGWWNFDEDGGEGSVVTDSSSNGHHGTIETIDANVWWVDGRPNDVNYALDFDGGRVRVPDHEDLRPRHQVSVSAWIKYSDGQSDARVVVKGADDKETYRLEVDSEDDLKFLICDGNDYDEGDDEYAGYEAGSDSDALERDEWIHVAGTFDGNTVKCYINGELAGESNDPNTSAIPFLAPDLLYTPHPNDLSIGKRPDANDEDEFEGIIDDVRIYNRGLSAEQIAWLASDGTGILDVDSIANLIDGEGPGKKAVNFRDLAKLGAAWFDDEVWP